MTEPRHARKTAVRARMAETGETYTQANAAIAAQRGDASDRRRMFAEMDARRDRYEAAAQAARDRNAPVHTGLWGAFGAGQPDFSRVEASLAVPTGDMVTWTHFTEGGRELAEEIDEKARAAGLRLADARLIRRRNRPHRRTHGPLSVFVWDLQAVLADVEADIRAGQEDKDEAQAILDENYPATMHERLDSWRSFAEVIEPIAIQEPPGIDMTGVDPELDDL
ncbi:hypothetical protein [Kitasatospora sp. NPDC090091]|uniref:hypothetical protein n=1 Tax=Kitasatospora sp. NPDC090091 TaxID=3364081 RepID=UPI00380B17DA